MLRASLLVLLVLCSGCMVLSHDAYFSPTSSAEHELRSPFPGNPWNSFTVFGSPADIITVELKGTRVGLCVRNSATGFGWLGPVFLPLVPIPARETLRTSQLRIWVAVAPRSDVEVLLDGLRIRVPDEPVGIPPTGIYVPSRDETDAVPVHEPHRVAGGGSASWYLEFALPGPEPVTAFGLEVGGITTAAGPLPPFLVEFSHVRGWRALSLP